MNKIGRAARYIIAYSIATVSFCGCIPDYNPETTMVKPIAHEIKIGRKVVLLPPYISREGVMIAPEKALEDTLEGMLSIKTEEGCDPLARKTTCLRWRDAEKISGFRKAYFSMADSVIAGADVNRIDPMYLCRKLDAGAVFLLLVTDEESVFSYDRPGSPRKTTHWENEAIIEKIYHTERFTLADYRAVLAAYDFETGRLKGLYRVSAKEYASAGVELTGEKVITDLFLAALDAALPCGSGEPGSPGLDHSRR